MTKEKARVWKEIALKKLDDKNKGIIKETISEQMDDPSDDRAVEWSPNDEANYQSNLQ